MKTEQEVQLAWRALLRCGVEAGQRYAHYRSGEPYTVVGLSLDEETFGVRVTYSNEATGVRWNRRLEVFTESVEHEGRTVSRFQLLR